MSTEKETTLSTSWKESLLYWCWSGTSRIRRISFVPGCIRSMCRLFLCAPASWSAWSYPGSSGEAVRWSFTEETHWSLMRSKVRWPSCWWWACSTCSQSLMIWRSDGSLRSQELYCSWRCLTGWSPVSLPGLSGKRKAAERSEAFLFRSSIYC